VYHPAIPDLAEARRIRAVIHGLDPIDRVLMDPATRDLLSATAARLATESQHRAVCYAGERELCPRPSAHALREPTLTG
jgi:hypothetical protein